MLSYNIYRASHLIYSALVFGLPRIISLQRDYSWNTSLSIKALIYYTLIYYALIYLASQNKLCPVILDAWLKKDIGGLVRIVIMHLFLVASGDLEITELLAGNGFSL